MRQPTRRAQASNSAWRRAGSSGAPSSASAARRFCAKDTSKAGKPSAARRASTPSGDSSGPRRASCCVPVQGRAVELRLALEKANAVQKHGRLERWHLSPGSGGREEWKAAPLERGLADGVLQNKKGGLRPVLSRHRGPGPATGHQAGQPRSVTTVDGLHVLRIAVEEASVLRQAASDSLIVCGHGQKLEPEPVPLRRGHLPAAMQPEPLIRTVADEALQGRDEAGGVRPSVAHSVPGGGNGKRAFHAQAKPLRRARAY